MIKFKAIGLCSVLLIATGSAVATPKGGSSYHHGGHSYQSSHGVSYQTKQPSHQSNGGGYAGIGLGSSEMTVDGVAETFEDTNIRAYMGYDLNRYFAIEGGVNSIPLKDYLNNVGDLTGIDVSVLAKLPVTSRLSAYARLGYWDWEFSDLNKNHNNSFFGGTDMLYGIGMDYQVSSKFKLRLDAIRFEADDAEVDTINGSIAYSW